MRILLVSLACFAVAGAVSAGTLSVKILDENGSPAPARVYLTDSSGQLQVPAGMIVYKRTRNVSEEHFVPPSGAFKIDLRSGVYHLVVERGKEYLPAGENIRVSGGAAEKTVRLRRWVRMTDRGWYSADMHIHRPLLDLGAIMEAEDLNFAVNITRWRVGDREIAEDPELDAFLAKSDANGAMKSANERWFTVLNEELEPPESALLVSRMGKVRSTLEYPMAAYGRALRQRGALVDSEKATSLELPAIAALGGCETVGLANNHLWRSGSFPGAWGAWPDRMMRAYPADCSGFALAGCEMYYALLNAGLPLKLSAGSANGVHPVPPGWSRIYAHLDGEFTVERWFEAVRAGRTFVTTGPMLLLTVNGLGPGQEPRGAKFPMKAKVNVTVLSPDPVREVELVVNGDVRKLPLRGSGMTWSGASDLELTTTTWIAARWMSGGDKVCGVAHTAPVLFRNGSQPVFVRRTEAEYLVKAVERLIDDVKAGRKGPGDAIPMIVTPTPVVREQTLGLLEQARDFYRGKL